MILNLTQHTASAEQIKDGVIDLPEEQRKELKKILTFDSFPTRTTINNRVKRILELVMDYAVLNELDTLRMKVMIGGAPYLMPPLEEGLLQSGFIPLYSFSHRVSVEDDAGNKTSAFKHLAFVRGR